MGRVKRELGRIGIWSRHFWGERSAALEAAAELEELGYGALWLPNGPALFELAGELLGATRRVVVATGIASIWMHPPDEAAAAHHALNQSHPGRFLLGLGVSHPHIVDRDQPGRYSRPLRKMREYLDSLDGAPTPVPTDELVLAALGPRMLELARDRSAGAHPYLGTVEHTRFAREVLGSSPLLAPELAVVLETDPSRARSVARQHLTYYLKAPNYTNNWLRLGFTPEDVAGDASDRLVDAVVAWGAEDAIRDRIAKHHEAGADHVCIQTITADSRPPLQEWRTLAGALSPAE
jgi:probable F420-dependent oxidoreductase